MPKKVIDLSKWNPVKDYYKTTKDIEGVILRCGYRGLSNGKICEDPLFKTHTSNFIKLGAAVGVYFFTTAINEKEAREEADWTISLIKSLNINLSFPIAIDTEYSNKDHTGRSDNLSNTVRTKAVIAFCDRVKERGYEAMIYASDSWFKYNLEYDKVKNYKKWVAAYSNKPNFATYNMIAWQKGVTSINGIDKPVDINEWYDSFVNDTVVEENKDTESPNISNNKLVDGSKVQLDKVNLYPSSVSEKVSSIKTGTFYIWSSSVRNRRIRITNKKENVGKSSTVVGWINISDLNETIVKPDIKPKIGDKIVLKDVLLYSNSDSNKSVGKRSGVYYIWSSDIKNNKIRITNKKENIGNKLQITGWVNIFDLK